MVVLFLLQNSADSSNHQLSPSVLSPPAYHIPITGKQHFTFNTLWPVSSTSASSKAQKNHIEEANLQLLTSDFNSSSGNSEPGSSVALSNGNIQDDCRNIKATPLICRIEAEPEERVIAAETSSTGTATWSGVTEYEGISSERGSFQDLSPDDTLHLKIHCSKGQNSRPSSQERTPERKHFHKQCHCHCKGHDSRRLVKKRMRCRSVNSESSGTYPYYHHHHHQHRHSCSSAEVQLREICVKNRSAKDANCDSYEEECLLPSEPESPLEDEEEDILTCNSKAAYGIQPTVSQQTTTDVHCLVHENLYCDTVC